MVLRRVVENFVVDLVCEDDQVMLAGQLDNLQQKLFRVNGTGRVVRVNDDDPAGARRNFGANIIQIREPVSGLITQVMHRFTAGERYRRRPERVIRGRNKHFVTAVQQGLHRLDDQFRNTVTDIDIFYGHIAHALRLIVLHDGFTR